MNLQSESIERRRLDGWQEIADYLRVDIRTAQRWEIKNGLPVKRLPHGKRGRPYAFTVEIDEWFSSTAEPPVSAQNGPPPPVGGAPTLQVDTEPERVSEPPKLHQTQAPPRRYPLWLKLSAAIAVVAIVAVITRRSAHKPLPRPEEPPNSRARLLSSATSAGEMPLLRPINVIPGSLIATRDGRRIYAIELMGKTVQVLNALDLRVEASVTLPSSALRAVISPDGNRIYIGSIVDGIMVIYTDTNRVEDLGIRTGGPVMDLDVSADGRKMYLAMGAKGLKEVDLRSREVRSISDDISPQFLKIDPTGRQLFVSYQNGGPGGSAGHDALIVYDLGDSYKPRRIPRLPRVGGAIMFVPSSNSVLLDEWDACSNPSYDREGCPAELSRVFHILYTDNLNVLKTLTLPVSVGGGMAYANGRTLAFGGEAIVIYDIVRQKTLERFSRPGESYGTISFAPHGERLFVALNNRSEILMFRLRVSSCSGPETGLTNLYSGDGTLDDVVGTGAAKVRGTVDFAPGVIGQAFHFGSDKSGFLEIGSADTCVYCGDDEWAISLFVKFASLQNEATILKRERAEGRFGYRLFKSRRNRMVLEVDQGAEKPSSIIGDESLISGKWYRIELISNGRSIEMFRDGVSVGRTALPAPDPAKPLRGKVYLGGTPAGTALDGWIDEIAFYNRELSVKEIQSRATQCVSELTRR